MLAKATHAWLCLLGPGGRLDVQVYGEGEERKGCLQTSAQQGLQRWPEAPILRGFGALRPGVCWQAELQGVPEQLKKRWSRLGSQRDFDLRMELRRGGYKIPVGQYATTLGSTRVTRVYIYIYLGKSFKGYELHRALLQRGVHAQQAL